MERTRRQYLALSAAAVAGFAGCVHDEGGSDRVAELENEVEELRAEIAEMEERNDELEQELQEKEDELEELRQESDDEETDDEEEDEVEHTEPEEQHRASEEVVEDYVEAFDESDVDTANSLHHPNGPMEDYEPEDAFDMDDWNYSHVRSLIDSEPIGIREYTVTFDIWRYDMDREHGERIESSMELRTTEDGRWRVWGWSHEPRDLW